MWLDRLERERENLRAVLQRATTGGDEEVQLALRLSNALLHFWWNYGYPSEGRSFLERGLAQSQVVPAHLRVKALITDGLLMWFQNDARRLAQVSQAALALARELQDQESLAYACTLQGIAVMDTRDYAAARSCFEEALALARALGDGKATAFVLMSLGRLTMYQREHQRAIGLFEESLALYRAAGDPLFIAILLDILARAVLRQGQLARAHVLLEESLAISRKVGANWGIAIELSLLGQIAFQQGEVERADALLTKSIQLSQEMGDRRSMVRTRLLMAGLAARQGNYGHARAQYEENLAIAIELGLAGFIASGLKGLGCVAAAQGQYAWSALLWGAAENRPESYSVAIPRTIYERLRAAARTHLGEPAFAQALAEGLTDAQVAEQLVISLRTVNAHLTSIYQKIHVSSRGAATRYALEHQLV
jgi:ATP/maltotriose-dependent transcriptional regulator MalT